MKLILLGINVTPDQVKAFEYYKKNSTSVEIVKDDVLQKINFRIKNKVAFLKK